MLHALQNNFIMLSKASNPFPLTFWISIFVVDEIGCLASSPMCNFTKRFMIISYRIYKSKIGKASCRERV